MTKRKTLLYFVARATMTLLVMLLTTATAWADDGVKYLDENGVEQTCTSYTVLTNQTDISTPLPAGWYVVESSVSYTSYVTFEGNVNLILADDAELKINCNTDEMCIYVSGNLNIYAQSNGDKKGTISTINSSSNDGIYAEADISIYGGSVVLTGESHGIYTEKDINIYGGSVTARGTSHSNGIGIDSYGGNITIKGGQVTAVGEGGSGISASSVTINGGIVTATGEYGINSYNNIIINGGTIEATGTDNNANGIYSYAGKIEITGGTVTAMGGIFNDTSSGITISGGKVTANGEVDGISSFGDIIIDGGDITATVTSNNTNAGGIWTYGGDIKITGGNVTATATGDYGNGLFSEADEIYDVYYGGTITISGGTVIANGNWSGIYAKIDDSNVGTITLSGGSVTAKASDENIANSYRGNVIIADGLIYSDCTNTYEGLLTLDNDQKAAIAGKGMHPIQESYPLPASLVDGNYWTTFYCGDGGYSIKNNDAYAYTATYGLNNETNEYELKLNKLGKDIPQGTAVIIVSSTASVSLTKNDNLGTFSGSNSLRGVDIRTPTGYITTNLGSGTFYVMGKKGDEFGFFKYTGAYMPARKAFLLIDGSNEALARGITMVFENSTGIKSIDKAQIGTESDAWYSLDGRKLMVKPTTKGVYINNGNKVVIK